MVLTIDIGNTNIHNGIFKGARLQKMFNIPTYSRGLGRCYLQKFAPYLKKIDDVIIVSVVPIILKKVEKIIRGLLHTRVLVVGRDVDSGVVNLYRYPNQVGQDRLVNARAACELYGGKCIIVDFGTALTIDIVNSRKEYLGGVIVCGVETSLWALAERTALLPRIKIKRPDGILGKDTEGSMISGAIYGFSSLCDGIVQRFKKRYIGDTRVILTGGLSRLIRPYCKTIDIVDPGLTLKGLQLIERDVCSR